MVVMIVTALEDHLQGYDNSNMLGDVAVVAAWWLTLTPSFAHPIPQHQP